MTALRKPIARESAALVRERGRALAVVVILQPPSLLGFRAKGCRTTYWLPADVCYAMAVKASVAADRRDRAARKKRAP